VRYDESIRGVSDQIPGLIQPAIGYVQPEGELERTRSTIFETRNKMTKYACSVPPLQRIARLEDDLKEIIKARKTEGQEFQKQSEFVHTNPRMSARCPEETSDKRDEEEEEEPATLLSNSSIIKIDLPGARSTYLNDDMDTGTPGANHPDMNGSFDMLPPLASSSALFSDVSPQIPGEDCSLGSMARSIWSNPSTVSLQSQQVDNRNGGSHTLSVRTDLLSHYQTQLTDVMPDTASPHADNSFEQKSLFALATEAKRQEVAASLAKRAMRDYLVRGHRPDSPDYELFQLQGSIDDAVYPETTQPSFNYTRKKLLSTKDKIYDCGPAFALKEQQMVQQQQQDTSARRQRPTTPKIGSMLSGPEDSIDRIIIQCKSNFQVSTPKLNVDEKKVPMPSRFIS
jgi:hypothetical protein